MEKHEPSPWMRYGNKVTDSAYEDLEYWKSIRNNKILKRIRELVEAIQQDPFKGIGKPGSIEA